jgi:phage terminase small subunit
MNVIEEVSTGKDGLKFKRTSKLAAMKQLAELAGYEAPKITDLTSSDGSMTPRQMSDAELMKIASE